MSRPAPLAPRQDLLSAAALGLIFLCAPFPAIQAIPHTALALALAPRAGRPLGTALWAAAGGWALEGSLRLFPHLGGTALADMVLALVVAWMAGRWPVEGLKGWMARLALLLLPHMLLVHGTVRLAAGPHAWDPGWLWALVSLPLWSWGLWRLLFTSPASRRH